MTTFQATVRHRPASRSPTRSVSLVLYMAAMPSMNMPAMRSEAALGTPARASIAAAAT